LRRSPQLLRQDPYEVVGDVVEQGVRHDLVAGRGRDELRQAGQGIVRDLSRDALAERQAAQ
jgi:hypothetical protein